MIPMEMTAPNPTMNSNILAGLTGDILKKVTKNIIDTTSAHATEAIQQGVPYGHVLEQLIKMAPPGANLMGGSGGGDPSLPPKPPAGPAKRADAQVVPEKAQVPTQAAPTQTGQPAAPAAVDGNAILSQLLAAMQGSQGGGQQMKMPSFLGGLIAPTAQDQLLLTEAAKNKQAMAGQTPMQIGDLQKIIAGVGGEQLSAQTVPLNAGQRATKEYQDKEIAAKTMEYQLNNAKEQMSALNQEQERATAEYKSMMDQRSWLGKASGFGTAKSVTEAYKAKLLDIGTRMDKARENLVNLADNHPALKESKTVDSKSLVGSKIGRFTVKAVK